MLLIWEQNHHLFCFFIHNTSATFKGLDVTIQHGPRSLIVCNYYASFYLHYSVILLSIIITSTTTIDYIISKQFIVLKHDMILY